MEGGKEKTKNAFHSPPHGTRINIASEVGGVGVSTIAISNKIELANPAGRS